jgi:plasmid stabilization system protein ParE
MTRRFIIRPLAEADLEDGARWYEDERAGLAERFLSEVNRTFARIRERPLQFPEVSATLVERCCTRFRSLSTFGRRPMQSSSWLSCTREETRRCGACEHDSHSCCIPH